MKKVLLALVIAAFICGLSLGFIMGRTWPTREPAKPLPAYSLDIAWESEREPQVVTVLLGGSETLPVTIRSLVDQAIRIKLILFSSMDGVPVGIDWERAEDWITLNPGKTVETQLTITAFAVKHPSEYTIGITAVLEEPLEGYCGVVIMFRLEVVKAELLPHVEFIEETIWPTWVIYEVENGRIKGVIVHQGDPPILEEGYEVVWNGTWFVYDFTYPAGWNYSKIQSTDFYLRLKEITGEEENLPPADIRGPWPRVYVGPTVDSLFLGREEYRKERRFIEIQFLHRLTEGQIEKLRQLIAEYLIPPKQDS